MVALHPITLHVRFGEVLAIVGPSGSGKTTLLHLLGLLLTPSSGSVQICGLDSASATPAQRDVARRRRVGFVFQEPLLIGHLDVLDNVRLWRPQVERGRSENLAHVLGIAACARRLPSQLSGGQQQRVALARALAPRPVLLLADEPTASLDDEHATAVLDVVCAHAGDGGAVVIATHDPRAIGRADRWLCLERGRVVSDGRA
ncbi:MAG: ATP-binding cassette domain-containing protein [Actinomycetota bacterium]|nr:ATP-binding cassette domain-containing protein [Actinomycetota bacterium]